MRLASATDLPFDENSRSDLVTDGIEVVPRVAWMYQNRRFLALPPMLKTLTLRPHKS
jgi:hypothetical protein